MDANTFLEYMRRKIDEETISNFKGHHSLRAGFKEPDMNNEKVFYGVQAMCSFYGESERNFHIAWGIEKVFYVPDAVSDIDKLTELEFSASATQGFVKAWDEERSYKLIFDENYKKVMDVVGDQELKDRLRIPVDEDMEGSVDMLLRYIFHEKLFAKEEAVKSE